MRTFSLQLLGVLVVYAALRLVADRGPVPFVLRDGALLALTGMILFAVNARRLWTPRPPDVRRSWSAGGRTFFLAGCLSALSGGALFLLDDGGTLRTAAQTTLWLLGMAMMLIGASWQGSIDRYRAPSHRWTVDATGAPVRAPLSENALLEAADPAAPRALVVGLALLILLLGAAVRLWNLTVLPPSCIDAECVLGLRLLDGSALVEGNPFDPFGWLTHALFRFTDDSLLSLRLAGAIVGILTLPLFMAAASQVSGAGGALIATLLLALNPWHIAAGRSGETWLMLALLLCVAFWATLRWLGGRTRIWPTLGGLATGALCLSAPDLRLAICFWALTVLAIDLLASGATPPRRWRDPALFGAGVITASLPAWGLTRHAGPTLSGVAQRTLELFSATLQGSTPGMDLPVLAAGAAALSLAGIAALVRWGRRPAAQLLLTNLLIFGAALLLLPDLRSGRILLLLPVLLLAAAVSLDQLLGAFGSAWAQVLRPATVLGVALALAAVPAGHTLWLANDALNARSSDARTPALMAMAIYVAENTSSDGDALAADAPRLLVPPALFEEPAAQLTAGPDLESKLVQPLRNVMLQLFSANNGRDVDLLLLPDQQTVQELLALLLPEVTGEPVLDEDGRPLYFLYAVPGETLVLRQGAAGAYFSGGTEPELIADQRDGPLTFDWLQIPASASPLRVEWTGSLLIPEAGQYRFAVADVDAADTVFTLLLDDQVVLDSSLSLLEQSEALAQGAYRLSMTYSTTASEPPPLAVTWTRPDGVTEPIPRTALVSPALPDIGLLGAYFTEPDFGGPASDLRKDLVIGAPADEPGIGAVEWRGKLAANRAGEYLLAIVADGDYQLVLNGRTLLDGSRAAPGADRLDAYREALAYLDPGWHDLIVRYVPAQADAALSLLWQPPGGDPTLLPAVYLAPTTGPLEASDRPLPPPPALVNPNLGDATFALTRAAADRNPQTTVLPDDLPALALTPVWQTAAVCGSGGNQLDRPHGVVIDPDAERIYVADTLNRRIVAYSLEGAVVDTFGDPQLEEVSDVALNPDGTVLALDAGSQQIYRIEPDEGIIEPLALSTGFYRPRGFDTNAAGMLFVADTGGGRVAVLEPGGATLSEYGGPGTLLGIGQPVDALATDTALWAVTSEDGRLWNLYTDASFTAIARAISIDGPHLAGLDDGSFFMSDPTRQRIFRYSATGRPVQQFGYPGAFELPTGIAVAEQGGELLLAVVDTQRCSLGLWQGPQALLE